VHDVVVRLKGGDPMLFGRAQEEIVALEAAGIRYEVVPGITAALAAAAEIGTSLTQRGSVRSVSFVTPRVAEGESTGGWATSLTAADSGAIYMGTRQADAIAAALIEAGTPASTPIAVIENASLPQARTIFTTLGALPRLAHETLSGPAVILVGPQFRHRTTAVEAEIERCTTNVREASA
jgi:uroporphyrin-III C-methyltransferase